MDYVINQLLTFQDADATNQKGDGPDDDVHVQFKEVRLLVYDYRNVLKYWNT